MSEQVPEYYQRFTTSSAEEANEQRKQAPADSAEGQEAERSPQFYRADSFGLLLPRSGWGEDTVYSFTGPVVDDLQHTITVTQKNGPDADTPAAFAAQERDQLKSTLDGWQLLMEGALPLACGRPAHRVIARWTPQANQTRYQEQLYLLHRETGYILSAGFTNQSRRQIGERVERILRSFRPDSGSGSTNS